MRLTAAGYSTATNHRGRQSPILDPSPDELGDRSPHLPIDSGISIGGSNGASGNNNADGFRSRQVNPTFVRLDNNQPTSGPLHSQFTANVGGNNITSRFSLWPPEYLARQVYLLHLKRQTGLDSRTVAAPTPASLPVNHQPSTQLRKVAGWQRDKIKLMELRIINLVEQSVREDSAESDGLKLAREAVTSFESLKSVWSNLRESEDTEIPLTSGPRMLDLALMVQCNLAARLASRDDQQAKLEAVEIYTQLCRTASQSASSQSAALAQFTGSSSAQSQEARFLLNRLGLNLGNLFSELGDQQKALRHYRLTLDRFSTLEGYRQLRVKLMHNISVVLMQNNQQQQVANSLGQLLADNQLSASEQADERRSFSPINANHHLFARNLALCHYQQSDSRGLQRVLSDLVRVDICHHYLSAGSQANSEQSGHNRGPALTANASHASRAASRRRPATGVSRNQQQPDDKLHDSRRALVAGDEVGGSTQGKLDRLIGRKRAEIAQCLLTVCNLIMELDEPSGTSSAFHVCARTLRESEHYSHLVSDLKMNELGKLLEQTLCRARLDEVIDRLGDICCQSMAAQQVAQQAGNQPIIRRPSTAIISGHRDHSLQQLNPNEKQTLRLSTMVVNNASFLYRLQGQPSKALELARLAASDQESSIACLNLANCHFDQADYVTAERLYNRALLMDPTCWPASYNLLLASRKLNRTLNELPFLAKTRLSQDCHRQSMPAEAVYYHKHCGRHQGKANTVIFSTIQMALIQQQSSQYKQSISILSDLITSSKQAPDVHLLASKLLEESGQPTKLLAIDILQQANREYPYYMPVLERIIAYLIKDFNYAEAKILLSNCIKNRPDQVRWYRMLAECHRGTTEYGKAIATYKAAIEDFPRDVTCLKAMIKLAEELGLAEDEKIYQAKLDRVTSEQTGPTTS